MRVLIDILILLMIVALAGGGIWYYQRDFKQNAAIDDTADALRTLRSQITIYSKVDDSINGGLIYPPTIDPAWYEHSLPANALAEGYPWLDIAPEFDTKNHPPDPVLDQPAQAGIWYNPRMGIFRARVPRQFTEQDTLDLYNNINRTALTALPAADAEERMARATTPNPFDPFVRVAAQAVETDVAPADDQPPRPTLREAPKLADVLIRNDEPELLQPEIHETDKPIERSDKPTLRQTLRNE